MFCSASLILPDREDEKREPSPGLPSWGADGISRSDVSNAKFAYQKMKQQWKAAMLTRVCVLVSQRAPPNLALFLENNWGYPNGCSP